MSNHQLATRDKNTAQALVDLVSARDRIISQSAGQAVADALWRYLDQPRTLLHGGESITETFCRVGSAILKVSSQSISGDLVYNVARHVVNCSRDKVTVSIAPATEGDLLDALETVKGSARLSIQEFLRIVRAEPAQPALIHIVNAEQVGATPKALRVVRDPDSGKISGAVSQPIN